MFLQLMTPGHWGKLPWNISNQPYVSSRIIESPEQKFQQDWTFRFKLRLPFHSPSSWTQRAKMKHPILTEKHKGTHMGIFCNPKFFLQLSA